MVETESSTNDALVLKSKKRTVPPVYGSSFLDSSIADLAQWLYIQFCAAAPHPEPVKTANSSSVSLFFTTNLAFGYRPKPDCHYA